MILFTVQDAVEEQQIVEDFMAAEQKKAATIVELDQYRKELDEMDLRKKEAVELIKDEVEQLAKITEREAQLEKNFGDTDPYECFAALKQTCTEREEELAGLYREIDQAEKEDQRVKERLRELQQRASNTIPVIIKNKDEVMRSMEDAWRMEKRKLYVVCLGLLLGNSSKLAASCLNLTFFLGIHRKEYP